MPVLAIAAIVAALAAAAGGGLSAAQKQRAEGKIAETQQQQAADEIKRQDAYKQEAQKSLSDTLNQFQPDKQEKSLDDATTKRTDYLNQNLDSQDNSYVPTSASGPSVVKTEVAKKLSDALGASRGYAASTARLGARNDMALGDAMALGEGQDNLNAVADRAGGSLSLLAGKQKYAAARYAHQPGFAELLQMAGGAASSAAMSAQGGGGEGQVNYYGNPSPYARGNGGTLGGGV